MASSGGISEESFRQLSLDISEWYDHLSNGINMLQVLYRDHVMDYNALCSATKMSDLLAILCGSGDLSPTNLSILYDTINVTGQFGFKPRFQDQFPLFQNVKEIAVSKFTWHRQKLLKLGMVLKSDDVGKLDIVYNMPKLMKYKDSWSLITDLEQKMIILEEEETMKGFTDNLNVLELYLAVRALTVTEGVTLKVPVKRKRDSNDQQNQKRLLLSSDVVSSKKNVIIDQDIPTTSQQASGEGVPVEFTSKCKIDSSSDSKDEAKQKHPIQSSNKKNPLDVANELEKCKNNLQLKDSKEISEKCKNLHIYFELIHAVVQTVGDGSIVFHLSVHDPSALMNLWEIHLSGELINDLAEIIFPEKHQQLEFLDEWMTCIDELEYKTALNKLKEKVPCDSEFCIVSDDTEWENQLMEDSKQRRPYINGTIMKKWRLSKPETINDLMGQSRKLIIAFSPKALIDYSKYAAHSVVLEMLEAKTLDNAKVMTVKISEDAVLPPEFESFTVVSAWEKHFVDQVLQNLDEYAGIPSGLSDKNLKKLAVQIKDWYALGIACDVDDEFLDKLVDEKSFTHTKRCLVMLQKWRDTSMMTMADQVQTLIRTLQGMNDEDNAIKYLSAFHISKAGIPSGLSDKNLKKLALQIKDWYALGIALDVEDEFLEQLVKEKSFTHTKRCIVMLQKWRDTSTMTMADQVQILIKTLQGMNDEEKAIKYLSGFLPEQRVDFTNKATDSNTTVQDFPAMLVRVSENIGEDLTMWKVALSDHIKNADAIQKATRAIQLFEELINSTNLKAEDIRILLETISLTGVLRLQECIPNCPRLDNIEITHFTKFRQSVMAFGKELTDDDIESIAFCYQLQRRYDDKWSLIIDLERKFILADDEKFDDFKSNLDQLGLRRLSRYLER